MSSTSRTGRHACAPSAIRRRTLVGGAPGPASTRARTAVAGVEARAWREGGAAGQHRPRRRAGPACGAVLAVTGLVQGVGFRPFVYALARELGLSGSVGNTADGRDRRGRGRATVVAEFARRLGRDAPALAHVETVTAEQMPCRGGTDVRHRATRHGRPGARWSRPTSPPATTAWPSWPIRPTAATGTRSSAAPTAVRASPSSSTCPTTGRPRRWRELPLCAACARRVRRPRPTAASTPRPSPARTAGRVLTLRRPGGA